LNLVLKNTSLTITREALLTLANLDLKKKTTNTGLIPKEAALKMHIVQKAKPIHMMQILLKDP